MCVCIYIYIYIYIYIFFFFFFFLLYLQIFIKLKAPLTQNSVRSLRPAEETNCWIKSLFLFSLHTKSILVTSLNSDWTTDGRWTILPMSFILFWALTVLFTWQSMGQSQASRFFIQNFLNCVPKTNEAFTGLERHGGKWLITKLSFWGGVTL